MITITCASIPERAVNLMKVAEALVPQCDRFIAYLNGYNVPPELEGITITGPDLGDAGKFYFCPTEGYHLTVDDDLHYPSDYVARMIDAVERYDRKAVVSLHGRRIRTPMTSYYRDQSERFRCLGSVESDEPAHIIGTGVMAYHTDTIRFSLEDFPLRNMADIHAAIVCERKGVPRVVVAHKKGMIRHQPVNMATTIATRYKHDDKPQTALVNSVSWGRHFRVVIPTFNRPGMLSDLLSDIRREQGGHRVDVAVYDDCSDVPYDIDFRGALYHRMSERHGKSGYWRLVNRIFADSRGPFDFLIYLPDDVRLAPNFFNRALENWQDDGVCLNLLMDEERRGKPQWVNHKPKRVKRKGASLWWTNWVDMCFMAQREMLETIGYRIRTIEPERWERNARLSSGVGAQISRRLHRAGKRIYQVDQSLVSHSNDHVSVMNPARNGGIQKRPTAKCA